MAKKRKRGSRPAQKRPDSPPTQPTAPSKSAPDSSAADFFYAHTEQTEHNHTYKWPGEIEVIDRLFRFSGNLLLVANDLGVSRTTLYAWMDEHPVLKEARAEANEFRLDKAEAKLDELIDGVHFEDPVTGNVYKRAPSYQAIQFLLRTVGKKRGYVLNNQPIQSNDSASHWDQLHKLFEQARAEFGDDP